MKNFTLVCLLLVSGHLFAAQTAQVLLVRGEVTKLEPGELEASLVKKGDKLLEDTSVLTGEKSFVKLRFADKSTMNLGAKSMVVINKLPEKKANMVNLLTGMLKAEVKKKTKKQTKTKLIIKTRTAVMGVRGTKFQTMYNSANKSTSLVTVEGKVAMVKQKVIAKDIQKIKELETKNTTGAPDSKPDEAELIEKAFDESKDVVEVTEGRYSGVSEVTSKPTVPVKIAPKQYDAIAKSMGSKNKAVDVMKVVASDPNPAGFVDSKTGTIAPKSGGIIDFSTGLYVAPTESAKLDKVTGTFVVDKKVGNVDLATGDYIPPKGIKIDAKKGFVIDAKESKKIASNQEKEELHNTLKQMNKGVEKQIVVNQVKAKQTKSESWKWTPKNHILSAQLKPFSEIMTVKNKLNGSEAEFYTEEANWMILTWKQEWNESWNSRLRIGHLSYEIDGSEVKIYDYGDENDDDDGYFSVGLSYAYSKKLEIFFDLVNRGQYYVVPTEGYNGSGVEIQSRSVESLDIGFEYSAGSWRGFDLEFQGALYLIGDSTAPAMSMNEYDDGEESTEFFGFNMGMSTYYAWKKNMGINSSAWYERMEANNSELEYTRNIFGLGVDFVWDI